MTPQQRREAVTQALLEWNGNWNGQPVLFDGLDHALVGVARQHTGPALAVYDRDLIIAGLVAEGLDLEDALDHFGYNIEGTYAGEGTPLILDRLKGYEGEGD